MLTCLIDEDFAVIRDTLYRQNVVLIKNQTGLSPKAQYEVTQRFDPVADSYGHGKTLDAKRSVLHPDLKTVPHQPQVQVIGNGFIPSYEGLENFKLVHPHHKKFHRDVIPKADDLDFTRFFRWHIDAALYGLMPPLVTSLLAVSVPKGRCQTVRYDDNTGDELNVPLGTTAFISGYNMYDILSDADKKFVRTSKIEYAPHPYVWMSPAKSRTDGLGMLSEGLELPDSKLPPIEESKIQILPMVWKNPVTGQLAVQIHPSAVRKIHLADGSVIDDLARVREIVHNIQRPAIAPQFVYPHDWEEGDLVLFNNHGVLHSVVGAFREDEVRLFRQCNMAASKAPLGPEAVIAAA
jgi:alpha-ketoglutarate-dependent taurine dioxygenase